MTIRDWFEGKGRVMRPQAHEADEQARLAGYRHIIERYLRYVLIRCTGYTTDKAQVQRIAAYTLATACLLFDKLRRVGQLGGLVEMMVRVVGEDPMADWRLDTDGGEEITQRVFVMDDRMCSVAGAINSVDPFSRELLILHHIERLSPAVLADAHGVPADAIRRALARGERQFIELVQGSLGWEDRTEPDAGALLVELADGIDLPWAEALGAFALGYAVEWNQGALRMNRG
jgi:hypothetical protein